MRHAWALILGLYFAVGADTQPPVGKEVPLFTISKSENRNQVQYAVRTDAQCVPEDGSPVYAYWRMLEQGPTRTAPLLPREAKAYGLASQRIVAPQTSGAIGAVRIVLNAVADRPVLVELWRAADGACRAFSTVPIAGAPAHLDNVFVQLKWPFGVAYLLLQGRSIDGTRRVEEKLSK
jgi:hypothetical protein